MTSGILVFLVSQSRSVVTEYATAAHTAHVWSAPPLYTARPVAYNAKAPLAASARLLVSQCS
jgi:hypothetical protein